MLDEFERRRRLDQQKQAEADGRVADSLEVRMALMERVRAGDLSLEAAQAELKRIKRGAKASGKITRNQAWLGR